MDEPRNSRPNRCGIFNLLSRPAVSLVATLSKWQLRARSPRWPHECARTNRTQHDGRGLHCCLHHDFLEDGTHRCRLSVIVHDITDGLNTILLVTRGDSASKKDLAFLLADAIAPVIGGTVVVLSALPSHYLALILGVTSGFFLFTATGDLLPDAHRRSPGLGVSAAAVWRHRPHRHSGATGHNLAVAIHKTVLNDRSLQASCPVGW